MKKIVSVLLLATLLLAVGCDSKETKITDVEVKSKEEVKSNEKANDVATNESTKIVFWDENAGPNRTPYYEHLIDKFEEENSDIEVEYVGIPWKSAKEKYDVAIASGSTPDVAAVPEMWIANFVAREALLELDGYFDAWDEKDQFVSSYININRELAGDGKLYQIPRSANTNVMWYRSDVFTEKGIKPVENWDDFYKSVEALTTDDMFGYSIRGGAGGAYQLVSYLLAYAGVDYYFDDNGKVFLREEKVLEGLEKLVDMYNTYTPESDITNGYKEMVATFDTGKAAMIQHNLGSYGEHSKTLGEGKFSAMPLPKAANGKRSILFAGANGTSIFKNTEHPEEAWRFLTSICSEYAISYWNENIGQLPTRMDVNDDPWMEDAAHIGVMAAAMVEEDVVTVRDSNYLPGQATVMNEVGQPGLQAVLLGELKPEDFLNDWANAFEKEYKEFMENK